MMVAATVVIVATVSFCLVREEKREMGLCVCGGCFLNFFSSRFCEVFRLKMLC